MRTLIYCCGLSIDKENFVAELNGGIDTNRDAIKAMFRASYTEKGDRIRTAINPIPGGTRYKKAMIYGTVEFSTAKSDYSYIAFETK